MTSPQLCSFGPQEPEPQGLTPQEHPSRDTRPHLDQLLEPGVVPGRGVDHRALLVLLCGDKGQRTGGLASVGVAGFPGTDGGN